MRSTKRRQISNGVQKFGIALILGGLLLYGVKVGAGPKIISAIFLLALIEAYMAGVPRSLKAAAVLLPLLALASATWASTALAAVIALISIAALLCVTSRVFIPRISKDESASIGIFTGITLLAVNFFVLRGNLPYGYWILYIASALSIFFLTGAYLSGIFKERTAAEESRSALIIFTLLSLEALFFLYFLPFGYFTLAFVFMVWCVTLLSLYRFFISGDITPKKAATEITFAVFVIAAAFLSSGIKPR